MTAATTVRTRDPGWETPGDPVELPAGVLAALEAALGSEPPGRLPVPVPFTPPRPAPAQPDPFRAPGPDWQCVVASTPEAVETRLHRLAEYGQVVEATGTVSVPARGTVLWLAWAKVHGQPRYAPAPTRWGRVAWLAGAGALGAAAVVVAAAWLFVTYISVILVVAVILAVAAVVLSGTVCPGCLCGTCKGH